MAKIILVLVILMIIKASLAEGSACFAEEIDNLTALSLIYSGKPITNATIAGDLNLDPLKLDPTKDIIICNSLINGCFDMSSILLSANASFSHTTFNGTATFARDIFYGTVQIDGSKFLGDVKFEDSIFSEEINCMESIFYHPIKFINLSFLNSAYFEDLQYHDNVVLNDIQFNGETISFSNSHFLRNVSLININSKNEYAYYNNNTIEKYFLFSQSTLSGTIFFSKTKFSNLSNIKNCKFYIAKFDKCSFPGNTNFVDNEFGDLLDLSNSSFKNIFFSSCDFNGDSLFKNVNFSGNTSFILSKFDGVTNFRGAIFSGPIADFSWTDFSGNTLMDNISFKALRDRSFILNDSSISCLHIEWDQIKGHLRYNGPAYLALVKNFKEFEKFEDADSCYYEYRRQKMLDPSRDLFSWILDHISLVTCGYGVRLSYTIGLSMLWILIFTLLFYRHEIFRDALLFSFITFLQLPRSDKYNEMIKRHEYAIIIEQILGWCMMALFIVVLTRKLIIS